MNEIVIKGTQKFMGISIPVVYGGFGEDQKVVLDKTVADVHNVLPSVIRKSINRLIVNNRMKENIDYIQLVNCLPVEKLSVLLENVGIRKQDIPKVKDIFALSERGYMKLIKAMDDDTSWDVMENFIDEYFRMKEHIVSPTLSADDCMAVIRHMEEREQKHYDTMMSMFKSFEMSMRNLAGVLITQNNTNIDTEGMIKESKSNYTAKGKKYRAEVIELCQQIVAISDFEDENAVLSACYKHLNKNYGIVWEQEIREWKEQHAWAGKVSALNVISESDDSKYLKSMMKNILMQILDDCQKKRVTVVAKSEINNEEVDNTVVESENKPDEMHISMVATDFESACDLVREIAKRNGDKSPHNAVTFMRIYKVMEEIANIKWYSYSYNFRIRHNTPKSTKVTKKTAISDSVKLQKIFVEAVNKYVEEILNAE